MRKLSMASMVLCVVINLAGCQPSAVIVDLGTLGGDFSIGLGINNAGNVTGGSYKSPGYHAFRYVDGLGMIDVGALPSADLSEAQGISNSGLIVGGSFVFANEDVETHAFLADSTLGLTDLGGDFGYAYAWDVNDRAQVTGVAGAHAFLWTRANGMQDLGTACSGSSIGRSINEHGHIAGECKSRNGTRSVAFRFIPGVGMQELGTLGGKGSSAYGINDSGLVVGESDVKLAATTELSSLPAGSATPVPVAKTGPAVDVRQFTRGTFLGPALLGTHAFLWTEGVGMIDLGHLGGGHSTAHAINNSGVVVGYGTLIDGTKHAFRWTKKGGMKDLNALLPRGSGWVLNEAWDINDKGQITGGGRHDGKARAFRLTPPEPPVLTTEP